jgi:hypothetical protein
MLFECHLLSLDANKSRLPHSRFILWRDGEPTRDPCPVRLEGIEARLQ